MRDGAFTAAVYDMSGLGFCRYVFGRGGGGGVCHDAVVLIEVVLRLWRGIGGAAWVVAWGTP